MTISRCDWAGDNPLLMQYHDEEWGKPVHDERTLFEFLVLEGMQAGLSWLTVLKKRPHYRLALDNFDPVRIARYDETKTDELMTNEGLIRNRLKIRSIITNAQAFLQTKEEHGDFADYLWQFVDGKPIRNHWRSMREVPARTEISDALSKELKRKGFKFVGSTICYAFMQATGMVNDHMVNCSFR